MPKPLTTNTLFYGDNLPILREYLNDESIDLIYLDPPFNSNRDYNVLFKEESGLESTAQIQAFKDAWDWDKATQATFEDLRLTAPIPLQKLLQTFYDLLGPNQMMAYLVMMTPRLLELHRVLKPTGSLYLHCDPTASHYLKLILDTIFGAQNFRNEIVWKRTSAHSDAKRYAKVSDTLFFYTKSSRFVWNTPRTQYDDQYVKSHYTNVDKEGRRFRYDNLVKPRGSMGYFYTLLGCSPPPNGWRMPESKATQWLVEGRIEIPPKGKIPAYKRYLDEMEGAVVTNVWSDISPVNSQAKDSLGYPTQKPLALLERIIQASSNAGDWILDPFCGCGTAIVAAQKFNRNWVGIDITHLAIALHKGRLQEIFGLLPKCNYVVKGEPTDLAAAKVLAKDDPYQFQFWAVSLIQALPYGAQAGSKEGKKGSDRGIDGYLSFVDGRPPKPQTGIVQVKSGKVGPRDIRDLRGTVEREGAALGVFITLELPTQEMLKEALSAGFYRSNTYEEDYPRLQILTVAELLQGGKVALPPKYRHALEQQAKRIEDEEQMDLGLK